MNRRGSNYIERRVLPPRRILHTEPSLELGGQEFRILAESEGMKKRGHAVVLAAQADAKITKKARELDIPVEVLDMSRSRYVSLVYDFMRIMKKHDIQIVNTHGSIDSWTASLAGRLSTLKPFIVRTRHKSTPISPTIRHRVLYGTLPHAIVTTGETVRQDMISRNRLAGSKIVSIPTGVDLDVYRPMKANGRIREELQTEPQDLVVGTISFLRSYKGVPYFLEAAARVLKSFPSTKFWIVGDGPQRETVNQQVREEGLENQVRLTGFREDIPALLAHMDVFVLASIDGEGIPQGVTQALAMERAAVATKVGGIPEVIHDGKNGYLVDPKNSEQLAEKICRLLSDQELRQEFGKCGRDRIHECYGLETMLDRTEQLYESLAVPGENQMIEHTSGKSA